MKMKAKALVAALTMGAAMQANAAIDNFSTGNGELFFNIRDNVNLQSYILDLNVNLNNFLPSNTTTTNVTYAADANLQNFLGSGSGNYNWSVMAGDSTGGTVAGDIRYATTTNDSVNVGANTNIQLVNYRLVDTDLLTNVNGAIGANNSLISPSTSPAYDAASIDTWSNNSPFNATASGVGNSLDFWLLTNSGSTIGTFTKNNKINVDQYAGQWNLASNGDLSFTSAAPVPLPPAVWLLGSALVGLVGVGRRKAAA